MLSNIFLWYYALCKRLVNKISFVIILCLIPLFAVLLSIASKDDVGFVRIALAAEEDCDEATRFIIDKLSEDTIFLTFEVYDSEQSAIEAVRNSEVDSAWVFPKDLENRIIEFSKGRKTTLTKVYVQEDNMFIKASREKLFGALYNKLSYEIYRSSVHELNLDQEEVTEQKLAEAYHVFTDNGIISYEYTDSTPIELDSYNYTTAPLRGFLATLMLICGIAATLYYIDDEKRQTFAMITQNKRYLVFYGNNLAAVSISSIFVVIAVILSGNYTSVLTETLSMMFLVFMITGFTVSVGCVFISSTKIGLMIPVLLILSLAFCPIFLNFNPNPNFQSILPQYLYLFSIGNISKYIWPMLFYSMFAFAFSFLLFKIRKR